MSNLRSAAPILIAVAILAAMIILFMVRMAGFGKDIKRVTAPSK